MLRLVLANEAQAELLRGQAFNADNVTGREGVLGGEAHPAVEFRAVAELHLCAVDIRL